MEYWAGVVTGLIIGCSITIIVFALALEWSLKPNPVKINIYTDGGDWYGIEENRSRQVHHPLS